MLGLGLSVPEVAVRRSGGSAPASDISALVIQSSTALDPSVTADAGLGVGVNGNGWAAKVTVPWQAATFDPTKISLITSDPGYDASGNVTTVLRIITGRSILRRQLPNQASLQTAHVGGNFEGYFSWSDYIYQGTTIVSAAASAGYFGTAAAGSITVTNSSTLAYPKPIFAWGNIQHERWTGATLVEGFAAHEHARNGQEVACIKYVATDAHSNTSATQTSGTPTLSTLQTKGQIAECYPATIPVTALTQADVCSVNAQVYPWIGDSTAVLNLAVDGLSWPTANPQTPLRFLNDKAGTYGGAIAYIRAGAGGTPQVSLTRATAAANPYATVPAALAACVTFNNANRGHNDHSGAELNLMDDGAAGAVAHTIGSNLDGNAAGNCWTDIRVDPAAVGAVSIAHGTSRLTADKLRWFVNFTQTASAFLRSGVNNNNFMAAFEGQSAFAQSDTPLTYQIALAYLRNVTFTGTSADGTMMNSGFPLTRTQCALALGVVFESATGNGQFFHPGAMIGCKLKRCHLQDRDLASYTLDDSLDGAFFQNNLFRDLRIASFIAVANVHTRGIALLQNVFERANVASTVNLQISADSAVLAIKNIVAHHNTIVGERLNAVYNNVAGSVGIEKRVAFKYNLIAGPQGTYNTKGDTFTNGGGLTVTGRVGTWSFRYTVGHAGNVCANGSLSGAAPLNDGTDVWLGEAWPAATYNVGVGNVTFVTDLSGGAAAGGGNYGLTGGSNAALNQVPIGLGVLTFAIDGTRRLGNGTDPAGAYPHP